MMYRVWSKPATFTSILCIYKAFKNIWMIVLNILGYFGGNKQNSHAALTFNLLMQKLISWEYLLNIWI